MSKINTYLQKIESGKPINFEAFERELERHGYGLISLRSTFVADLIEKRKYQVRVIDTERFELLKREFAISGRDDRVGAALDGNSHKTKVSGSILAIRSLAAPHPQMVMFTAGDWYYPAPLQAKALLVENLENFLDIESTLALLPKCGVNDPFEQFDVVFASGNQINNRLHAGFLGRYEAVHCLFDADAGGLTMFRSLRKMLAGSAPVSFLYPNDIAERIEASRYRLTEEERTDLLRHIGESAATDQLIGHMHKHGRALEQETYLNHTEKRD